LDGFIQQSYAGGTSLHLGDTGLRLLAGNVWLDLVTDERVVLPIDEPMQLRKVAWTKGDTRFYACCAMFSYDDIRDLRWSPDGTYLSWVTGSTVVVLTLGSHNGAKPSM
jgi:hypothetical protein